MPDPIAPTVRVRPPIGPRTTWGVLAVCIGVTVLLRVPFWNAPLTADEGGYAYVARAWSRGATLYRTAWVDRPQGLLLLYRAVIGIGGHGLAIRLMATLWAAALVVVIALIGRTLTDDWRPGLWAAGLLAVASGLPQIEGFAANGELLAALPSALGVLLMAPTIRGIATGPSPSFSQARARTPWIASGGCCAVAILIKQSGYDAALAITGLLAVAWTLRWWPRRRLATILGWWALGFIVPIGLAAAHGALTGWRDWWFAMAGYRLAVESVTTGPLHYRWLLFRASAQLAKPLLWAVGPFALVGLLRRPHRPILVVCLWAVGATTAFALGGLYHPHYYIGLLPSFCLLGGLGVDRLTQTRWPSVQPVVTSLATIAGLSMLVAALPILTMSSTNARITKAARDGRLAANRPLAIWLRAQSSPSDTIYAMYADAALYFEADRDSPYPYLWQLGVEHIPGALDRLATLLDGPNRPRYVITFGSPKSVPTGPRFVSILARRYKEVAIVGGAPVYERITGS